MYPHHISEVCQTNAVLDEMRVLVQDYKSKFERWYWLMMTRMLLTNIPSCSRPNFFARGWSPSGSLSAGRFFPCWGASLIRNSHHPPPPRYDMRKRIWSAKYSFGNWDQSLVSTVFSLKKIKKSSTFTWCEFPEFWEMGIWPWVIRHYRLGQTPEDSTTFTLLIPQNKINSIRTIDTTECLQTLKAVHFGLPNAFATHFLIISDKMAIHLVRFWGFWRLFISQLTMLSSVFSCRTPLGSHTALHKCWNESIQIHLPGHCGSAIWFCETEKCSKFSEGHSLTLFDVKLVTKMDGSAFVLAENTM